MRIVITAGFDRSMAALALCELLQNTGHDVIAVIVTAPFNWQRIKHVYAQRGMQGLLDAFHKLSGTARSNQTTGALKSLINTLEVEAHSLKTWCHNHGRQRLMVKSLNSQQTVRILEASEPDLVVYAGGGILRKNFIAAAKGNIINPHSGPLPQIRGMNAIEWALLLDEPLQATIHIIDQGIDSGAILGRFDVDIEPDETIESLREKAVVAGIEGLVRLLKGVSRLEDVPVESNRQQTGNRQCFVMAPALKTLVKYKLSRVVTGSSV